MDKGLKPPKQIWYSLYAFLSTVPVVIGDSLLRASMYEMDLSLRDINVYLLDLAITVLIMLLILRRKNWARLVYTILTGLVVLAALWTIRNVSYKSLYNAISLSVQVILRLVSVHFLFVKQSREWFRPSYMHDSTAEPRSDEPMVGSNTLPDHDTRSGASPLSPELTPSAPEATPSTRLRRTLKEKRGILFAGVLIISICLLVVFIHIGRRAMTVAAIRSALSADVSLTRQIFGSRSSADCDAETVQAYAQGLREIDMARCPMDFQLAYLDHIHAWESLARSRASVNVLGCLIEAFVLQKIPNISDFPDEQPINDEIARTWEKIERIALSYGVRVPEGTR